MQRLLIVSLVIGFICVSVLLGSRGDARADSTVRFQLEIIPVADSDDDDDKKDDDDEKEGDAITAPVGGVSPGLQAPSTPLEVIVSKITPETVVASRFPHSGSSWCVLELSRSLPAYILLNILVLAGLFLWIIGLWWVLPRRSLCINGYAYIHKSQKDDQLKK